MKILLAGEWRFDIYEKALSDAFTHLRHDVIPFCWHSYFEDQSGSWFNRQSRELQRRLRAGPKISQMNAHLIDAAVQCRADAIFVFRGDLVMPDTLRQLRRKLPNAVLAGYNNDNPYSPGQPSHRFRHFVASLKELDLAFAYRPDNVRDFERAGAPHVVLLPPWYIPALDRPIDLSEKDRDRFECDIVFIGHFEPDGRLERLEALAEAGHRIRLFGTGWEKAGVSPTLAGDGGIRPVRGDDYRKALCAAKIALVFLSKVNDDRYTRRNFEIPATGTFMLSEFTDELATHFEPGIHADYFRNEAELVEKAGYYLHHEEQRHAVARRGLEKVKSAGCDVVSRAEFVIEQIDAVRKRLVA